MIYMVSTLTFVLWCLTPHVESHELGFFELDWEKQRHVAVKYCAPRILIKRIDSLGKNKVNYTTISQPPTILFLMLDVIPVVCWIENKATGWLGALVRVTNLKLSFLRVREKMLVFAGVVKKCVQHGHSFRFAGVWLKSENLNFACAVTRFFSSRVKKH